MSNADGEDPGKRKTGRLAQNTGSRFSASHDRIVPIDPKVLQWAVERSGISRERLMKRFKGFLEWERGAINLTYNQMHRLADALHVPSGYLLMSNPPDEKLPVQDLRTFSGGSIRHNSADLVETVYSCKTRQNWYRDFSRDTDLAKPNFVGSVTIEESPSEVAKRMHIALDLRQDARWNFGSDEEARRILIKKMDFAGVLVMSSGVVGNNTRRRLCPDEFRGFTLSDYYAPVVFVNRNVTASEQLNTLANKLAHIWINSSVISNHRSVGNDKLSTTEDWCTKVAVQFLAPLQSSRGRNWHRNMPERSVQISYSLHISRDIHNVSNFHSYTRPRRSYDDIIADISMLKIGRILDDIDNIQIENRKSLRGFYPALISRVGKRFAHAVVSRCLGGKMPYQDAYEMLGISSKEKLMEIHRHIGMMP